MAYVAELQISQLYQGLPRQQRKRVAQTVYDYVAALEKAINTILAPTVGWSKSQGQYLATDEVIPLYGVGSTAKEALEEYRSVVVEYYESLEEDEAELSQHLKEQLTILRQIFSRLEEGK